MSDIERDVISKAIQTKNPEKVISAGFEVEHFLDKENREVWEYVITHTKKYNTAPSKNVITEKFEDFKLTHSSDPLDYLCDVFRNKVKHRQAIELGRAFMKSIDDSDQLPNIELVALDMARTLTEVVPTPEVSRYSDMDKRIVDYEERKEKGEVLGINTGLQTIDKLTQGIQPHELVVIAAFLGVGKSTMMQWVLFNAYLQGKTPLMISLEMEHEAMYRKWDTMATHFEYNALKALELGEGDMEKWKREAERAANAKGEKDIIVIDDIYGCTAEKVQAETYRYKPDIVGVDYINLMKSREKGQQWERIQDVTRSLKQNARTMGIPIVAAAQGNRETAKGGVNLDTVASSLSIAQDCDLFIALHQDEDLKRDKVMEFALKKNRDGPTGQGRAHWELKVGNIYEITEENLMNRRTEAKDGND